MTFVERSLVSGAKPSRFLASYELQKVGLSVAVDIFEAKQVYADGRTGVLLSHFLFCSRNQLWRALPNLCVADFPLAFNFKA